MLSEPNPPTKNSACHDHDCGETNFVFPVRDLESERVRLTPFIPALHDAEFVEQTKTHPDLFRYLPFGPFDTLDDFTNEFFEKRVRGEKGSVLFAILDKTGGGVPRLAGVVGLLNASVINQAIEIGFITVFPEFHRTHITSNAVGLLLHYCLEVPRMTISGSTDSNSDDAELKYGEGLGLRRVQWQTHGDNIASLRTAERMGFRLEGLIRWQRVLPEGKHGESVDSERRKLCSDPGRHSWMLSVCWDDWSIGGTREVVREQMKRERCV